MPIFYLAWVNEGVIFSATTHATTATKIWDGTSGGEEVFTLGLDHAEGEFPSLTAELRNPRVGLLSAGRNQWIWLSADDGAGPAPLFTGRIVGVPKDLAAEVVEVQFVARPPDYIAQRGALAQSLRVLPWFDRVWIADKVDDDDTVLEAYPLRWHIDRVTLRVTASDIITGEDGTLIVSEADHFYDDISVSYSDTPLRKIGVSGTVTWDQSGSGDVDLTRRLVEAFQAAGSHYPAPLVASFTGDGLFSDWPQPLASIGGGWEIAATSTIEAATWIGPSAYVKHYGDRAADTVWPWANPLLVNPSSLVFPPPLQYPPPAVVGSPPIEMNLPDASQDAFGNWEVAFPLAVYKVDLIVHWDASRARSEVVTAQVEADMQPLLVDPGAAETDTIDLSSDLVGQGIDPDVGSPGAFDKPIGDLRRNSYFKTDRGAQSFEYLLLLARAKLLSRARAVEIKFKAPWSLMSGVSCRQNVQLADYRLPGGSAVGKVIAYTLSASGDDANIEALVTIGCTIGYGIPLGAAPIGTPLYVEDGYVDDYQQRQGAYSDLVPGVLQYQSFDEFAVTDDDGVDLFNLTASSAVNSLTVTDGPGAQMAAIDIEAAKPPTAAPSPSDALGQVPTVVNLDLVPVAGGAFAVAFAPFVSQLVVPQTINLEAP